MEYKKNLVIIEMTEYDGPKVVGIIFDVRSSEEFILALVAACKDHFDANDVQILDRPDAYTTTQPALDIIKDALKESWVDFTMYIRVDGEEGHGSTLLIQETFIY